jgi:alpha-ribazole phosphatase
VKLVLVRHPPPDIAPGICYGRLDLGLRADGSGAVAAVVASLAAHRVTRIWSSPARRCRVVAEAIGAPVRLDPRLLELDFGAWEGVAWDDVPRAALDAWAADPLGFAAPGGETGAALLARVESVHRALLAALLRGEAPDLLAPAPPLGSVEVFLLPPQRADSSASAAHSATTEAAPSTSPV